MKDPKVGYIHAEIPAEMKRKLRIRCSYENTRMSQVVRELIKNHLLTPSPLDTEKLAPAAPKPIKPAPAHLPDPLPEPEPEPKAKEAW